MEVEPNGVEPNGMEPNGMEPNGVEPNGDIVAEAVLAVDSITIL